MKKYYEILEVNEKASKEIIEKAYKVLAKKYHPDLQEEQNKEASKRKMQEINEAYEILSDDTKRADYDQELAKEKELELQRKINQQTSVNNQAYNQGYTNNNNQVYNQNFGQNTNQTYTQNYNQTYNQNYDPNFINENLYNQYVKQQKQQEYEQKRYEKQVRKQQEQYQKQINEQYENAYYDYLRSLGYKIKEKWTWKKTLNLIIIVVAIIMIFGLLWVIPATHDWMMSIYEGNIIVKIFVDLIISFVKAIVNIFENPPQI